MDSTHHRSLQYRLLHTLHMRTQYRIIWMPIYVIEHYIIHNTITMLSPLHDSFCVIEYNKFSLFHTINLFLHFSNDIFSYLLKIGQQSFPFSHLFSHLALCLSIPCRNIYLAFHLILYIHLRESQQKFSQRRQLCLPTWYWYFRILYIWFSTVIWS